MNTKSKHSNRLQWLRYSIQGIFLVFIAQLVIRHAIVPEDTFLPSSEAYCPFGGIETLYTFFFSGGATIPHAHLSNLIILLAVIATAIIAKSAFCGWICPFGTIQEWLKNLGGKLGISPNNSLTKKLDKWDNYLQNIRYLVLIWILIGTYTTGQMVFRDYDPYASLLRITEIQLTAGFIILFIVLIASVIIERLWCRYLCPLGAIVSLFAKFSLINIRRNTSACYNCNICSKVCPSNIKVSGVNKVSKDSCISCLKCIDHCPEPNALELIMGSNNERKNNIQILARAFLKTISHLFLNDFIEEIKHGSAQTAVPA